MDRINKNNMGITIIPEVICWGADDDAASVPNDVVFVPFPVLVLDVIVGDGTGGVSFIIGLGIPVGCNDDDVGDNILEVVGDSVGSGVVLVPPVLSVGDIIDVVFVQLHPISCTTAHDIESRERFKPDACTSAQVDGWLNNETTWFGFDITIFSLPHT